MPGNSSIWTFASTELLRWRGKLNGCQTKLTARQRAELAWPHANGEYTVAELMEVFSIGRAPVYRVLDRAAASTRESP
ncbi:hypothetical protein [Actinopolymorpha alba]|uniref:hypothetical protein n=1 Tax=Actinopolymorpha alba TaxID=533267 RepID=UPI00035F7562|nr:hypothetical protein [Actinopolymorpha alba]